MRIGIFLPNWIGDVVMATPALRALRRHFTEAHLVGILRPYVAPVLEGSDWLDSQCLYDPRGREGQWSLVRSLRRQRLAAALLLTNSLRTAALAWLGGARRRVGYARGGRGWLLTDRVRPPRQGRQLAPVSPVDYYLRLVGEMGCPAGSRETELATCPEDEQAAEQIWRARGWSDRDRVVALNTGGAYGAAKDWPRESFAALARQIVQQSAAQVLVLCGPAEEQTARWIEQQADTPRVRSLAGEPLGIGLTKACVRRSCLLVTTDSGPRHFAAGLGVPAVALFGPTDPRWSENYNPCEIRLQHPIPCAPCARRSCPLGHHRCMRELAVERVFQAVQPQLQPSAVWTDQPTAPTR
jgi:heptosyltransferase-2